MRPIPPRLKISVNADPNLDCEIFVAPGLTRFQTEEHPDIELHVAAGSAVKPGEEIGFVPSGFQLWQLWRNGYLATVDRYNYQAFAGTGLGVNTHEAFELLHQEMFGKPVGDNVVASGERRAAFGEDWYYNNKSGKYRGPSPTLDLAVRAHAARGYLHNKHTSVAYMDRTKKEDLGHSKDNRSYDRWQLELMRQVLSEPEGFLLVSLYDRLGRVLRPYTHLAFDEGVAKRLGLRAARVDEYNPRIGGVRDIAKFATFLGRGMASEAYAISYTFNSAINFDGIYYAIQSDWHAIDSGMKSPETYVKYTAPTYIDQVLKLLGPMLAGSEIAELESLKVGFASLPARRKLPEDQMKLRYIERPKIPFAKPPEGPTSAN